MCPDLQSRLEEWCLDERADSSYSKRNCLGYGGFLFLIYIIDLPVAGILFTITDISDQRLYEASQLLHAQEREATARKRAEEAEERRKDADERRRSQGTLMFDLDLEKAFIWLILPTSSELLIDVTSHELRQPVSAILNCSALVRENLAKLRNELCNCYLGKSSFLPDETLLSVIDDDLDALDSIYQVISSVYG